MTEQELKAIIFEARAEAHKASAAYYIDVLNRQDQGACGFAWTSIHDYQGTPIKGNTKLGRLFKKLGISQNYERVFHIWNPGKMPVQNIECLEKGADAAARVFQKYGFSAYGCSRLD